MGMTGKLMRARAIEEQLNEIEEDLRVRQSRRLKQAPESLGRKLNEQFMMAQLAKRRSLIREFEYSIASMVYQAVKPNQNGVTRDEIERARTYPIENILDVKKGIARCISGSHEDKNPSMDVRNNFCYCYSCGWSGDSIDVAMKMSGLSFSDAVKKLQ
jgi:hypothetical protein